MWHELVHVKVTAAQALWEKAQSKSRLVSKYQFVYLPCLGCSPRLGGSRILCFMRCVCVNIMVYVNINNVPHYNIIPISLEIHIHERGTRKIFMGGYSFFFWRMGCPYSGFIMFCCINVLYFVLVWGRTFI